MDRESIFTAQFDVISDGGRRRFNVHTEGRDRNPDGTIPAELIHDDERYELDVADDDGVSIYVRHL